MRAILFHITLALFLTCVASYSLYSQGSMDGYVKLEVGHSQSELSRFLADWIATHNNGDIDLNPHVSDSLLALARLRAMAIDHDSLSYHFAAKRAGLHYQIGSYFESITTCDSLLTVSYDQTQHDFMHLYRNLYECYLELNMGEQALAYVDDLVRTDPHHSEKEIRATSFRRVWYAMGVHHELIREAKERIETHLAQNDSAGVRGIMNDLGVYYNRAGHLDSALSQWSYTLNFMRELALFDGAYEQLDAVIKSNMGSVYKQQGKYRLAIRFLEADLDQYTKGTNHSLLSSQLDIADTYRLMGNLDSAKIWLNITRDNIPKSQTHGLWKKHHLLLAQVYDAQGKPELSGPIYRTIYHVQDSIAAKKNRQSALTSAYALKVEDHRKEVERTTIKAKESILQAENANMQRNYAFVLGIALLILACFAALAYHRQRNAKLQIQEKTNLIQSQKDIIQKSLENKQTLLNEIHHRVKNNLQIISGLLHLQSWEIEDPMAKASLESGQQRIRTMALIHEMLYQDDDIDEVDLSIYIRQLVNELMTAQIGDKDIQVTQTLEPIMVSLDTAIPLGLTVNEVVGNSMKHAFPNNKGSLSVSLKKVDKKGGCLLEIQDSGPGLPEVKRKGSLGLRLIELLSSQLEGSSTLENKNGVYFTLTFNAKQE